MAAQGFGRRRPSVVTKASLRRTIATMGVLQLDTVNVFERSHYLPLWSRLGPYDRRILDALLHHDRNATTAPKLGGYTEYLAHEAAVLPVADWPLWAWHRNRPVRERDRGWIEENRGLFDDVRAEFAARGPLRVRDLDHPENVSLGGGWWNKNRVHWAAMHLFSRGELVTVGRERFERVLALADDVLPQEARVEIPREEAVRELVRRASVAHGIATVSDLADYPRISIAATRRAVESLVAEGELEPVEVEGWDRLAYLAAGQRIPRAVHVTALLSPFDPLVWCRPRTERLFDFHYRISIYTPAAQRLHGYYVLPVLVDGDLVGRIDLKGDRKAGVLRVQHAHLEPASAGRARELAQRVVPLLEDAAAWQGLGDIQITGPGTWAPDLAATLR